MVKSRARRRLGQNFLADTNLLEAIVREAALGPGDVVLEIGTGEGALSTRLADRAAHLHSIEVDHRLEQQLQGLGERPNVSLHWGDAMRLDLPKLMPPPNAVVSNLPYSVATPLLLRTIEQLPSVLDWTVMMQREVAERLRAAPGSRLYGAPSVLVQLAGEVELARRVGREVFVPRPRVDSALLRIHRTGPAPRAALRDLVRDAFAHRRKSLARSLELAQPGRLGPAREALRSIGLAPDARAETLRPEDFTALASELEAGGD